MNASKQDETSPAVIESLEEAGQEAEGLASPRHGYDRHATAAYTAKATALNNAIQDIGMGRYQWQLFVVIGFGWATDNLWPIVVSLILPPVS